MDCADRAWIVSIAHGLHIFYMDCTDFIWFTPILYGVRRDYADLACIAPILYIVDCDDFA